jgi:uncharacterized protein
MISKALIKRLKLEFALNWRGIHGVRHWSRVRINGLYLAKLNGANTEIIELFAFLHDSKRENDNEDPLHGQRGAEFAETLRNTLIKLNDHDFELLKYACKYHSDGLTEGDITVQTCWDADRLDLGRVGILPNPKYLCTVEAKNPEVIEAAYQRSVGAFTEELI